MASGAAEAWKAILSSGADVLDMMSNCPFNFPHACSMGESVKAEIASTDFYEASEKLLAALQGLISKMESQLGVREFQDWKFELVKLPRSPVDQLLSIIYGYHTVRFNERDARSAPMVHEASTAAKVHKALELFEGLLSINRNVCNWLVEDQTRSVLADLSCGLTTDSDLVVVTYGTECWTRGSPGTVCKGWVLQSVNGENVVNADHAAALIAKNSESATLVPLLFSTADLFIEKLMTLVTTGIHGFRVGLTAKLFILGHLLATNSRATEYILSSWGAHVQELMSVLVSTDERKISISESVAEVLCLLCLPQAPGDLKVGYQPVLECPICTKLVPTTKVWRCQTCRQPLHLACFAAWAQKNRVCPSCRSPCAEGQQDHLTMSLFEELLPFVGDKTRKGEPREEGTRFLAGIAVAHTASAWETDWVARLREADFFQMLHEALAAAVSNSEWPKASMRYPQVWKLCLTLERLAGFSSCRADIVDAKKVLEAWLSTYYSTGSGTEARETRDFADRALIAIDTEPLTPLRMWLNAATEDPCVPPNWAYVLDQLEKMPEDEGEDITREVKLFAQEVLEEHSRGAALLSENRSYSLLNAVFRRCDLNGDGFLERDQFSQVLLSVGVSKTDVDNFFRVADLDGDCRVSFEEFNKWLHAPVQDSIRASVCQKTEDNSGQDVLQTLSVWVPSPSWENLADILNVVGTDNGAELAQQILINLCEWGEWAATDMALLQVLRWCSRFVTFCSDRTPYERVVKKYADQRGIPVDWDVDKMLKGVGSFLMSKVAVEDVSPFQRLVDATFRVQLGRDRRGQRPKGFHVDEVKELCHEANWTAYTAHQKALKDKRGVVEWPWRLPRTSGQKVVNLYLSSVDKSTQNAGYAAALGFKLDGLKVVNIEENGLLWRHNEYDTYDDPNVVIRVGDVLKAFNGYEGDDGLKELQTPIDVARLHRYRSITVEFWSAECAAVQPLDSDINEYWLWHGAPLNAAQSIATGHFQVSLAAKSGMYGAGIYFAESVTKSDEYTDRGIWTSKDEPEPLRCLLLCRVSMGSVLYNADRSPSGSELQQQVLSGAQDCVLGDRERCSGTHREFIVFNANAVYPNYAVFYRRDFGK